VKRGEFSDRPTPLAVGWCHNCETWQRGSTARWRFIAWTGTYEWVCVRCDDELWGRDVWLAGDGNSLNACPCHQQHADDQVVSYGCPN
jgi:hypothetical protein